MSDFQCGGEFVEGKYRTLSKPYLYEIAERVLPGHTPLHKTGRQTAVSTNLIDLWGSVGAYVPPSAPMQMSVKSTDNTQDKAGGTGALSVRIDYLDTNYAEQTTTVTLNGTTWVDTTPTNILRVQRFRVLAGNSPVGNITIVDKATRAIIYSFITAGITRAYNSFWTVPAGKILAITSWCAASASGAAKNAEFTLKSTSMDGELTALWYGHAFFLTEDNSVSKEFTCPFMFPAMADIKISVKGSGALSATGCYEGWYEDV